jgi:hypothetical protein
MTCSSGCCEEEFQLKTCKTQKHKKYFLTEKSEWRRHTLRTDEFMGINAISCTVGRAAKAGPRNSQFNLWYAMPPRAAGFADQPRGGLAMGSVLAMIAKKYKVLKHLVPKLRSTPKELMDVLVARLGEWHELDIDEMMASNGLPSVCTLQSLGLIEPTAGVAAWGYFCFRKRLKTREFLLYHPERRPFCRRHFFWRSHGSLPPAKPAAPFAQG